MINLTFNSLIGLCILHTMWIVGVKSQALTRLGQLNVNKDFITMSGFSSGGTFAQQVYVSYSSLFSGIAVFSHTYYRCGPGNGVLSDYDNVCTTNGNLRNSELYNPNNALIDIHNYYRAGLIDDPHYMANKPLYVFAGTRNYLFTADMSLRILQVFEPFIQNPSVIKTRVVAANLTLPNNRKDLPACAGPLNEIQISNCGFSGAFESLQFLLGREAVRPPRGSEKLQQLIPFDQSEFFYGVERHDMDQIGYAYVPKVCQNSEIQCLLHFYMHGCSTGREFVGPNHALNSGFLEVAETNGIIVIFPQAVSSAENTIGCWDTFGVLGEYYATQRGAQVTVIKNLLDRILGKDYSRSNSKPYTSYKSSPRPKPQPHIHFATEQPVLIKPHLSFAQEGPNPTGFPHFSLDSRFQNDMAMTIPLPVSEVSQKTASGTMISNPSAISSSYANNNRGYLPDFNTNSYYNTKKCAVSRISPNTVFERCYTL